MTILLLRILRNQEQRRKNIVYTLLYLNGPTAACRKTHAQLLRPGLKKPLWCAVMQLQRCELSSWIQTAESTAQVLSSGKEKPHIVFGSDFFSTTRCHIFSYFFLIVSIAIRYSRCFFKPLICQTEWSITFFFPLVAIKTEFIFLNHLFTNEYCSS